MKNALTLMGSTSRFMVSLQFSILSLLSAFLLFQVQPVISKFILPWFGGGPGVWTTCMLFFQVVLFAGYGYAHVLTRLPQRWQGIIHAILVVAAAATLPIAPGPHWKPTGLDDPAWSILLLLLAHVGLPYFVLSSTSPLVQVWFSRSGETGSPWRLYALSNIGSLVALLSYPFLIEPHWDVEVQTSIWSGAFLCFGLLSCIGALADRKRIGLIKAISAKETEPPALDEKSIWWRRMLWVLLPAIASVMLLAATNHLCQDVAVIPFLWVIPLSLYLLSFIICFEHERWYVRGLWAFPAMVMVLVVGTHDNIESWLTQLQTIPLFSWVPVDLMPNFQVEIALACSAMFLGCMVCHGELVRLKPAPRHLTEFYLLMSAGGALGGLFVSLIAPMIFDTYLEWPGILLICFICAALAFGLILGNYQRKWLRNSLMVSYGVIIVSGVFYLCFEAFETDERIERVRNFYGVISINDDVHNDGLDMRTLYHGNIVHGYQKKDAAFRNEPLSYYGHETGIGQALLSLNGRIDVRVGVVGMGVATVAGYGEAGHTYRFYEINPEIIRFARKHFYFLSDLEQRGGVIEIALGDARRNLEVDQPQQFDVLLLDAFSGDSVPVHLLTQEAFAIYLRHMKPDGIIAVHVSNRYLTLTPVVEKVAASLNWKTTCIDSNEEGGNEATDYVIVTNNEAFLRDHVVNPEEQKATLPVSLWTDRSHNLFEILKD